MSVARQRWDHWHGRDIAQVRRLVAERNRPQLPWSPERDPGEVERLETMADAYDGSEALAEERAERARAQARLAAVPVLDERMARAVEAARRDGTASEETIADVLRQWAVARVA